MCTIVVHSDTHTVLKVDCCFRFSFDLDLRFVCVLPFCPVVFAFIALDLVSSVRLLSQETG